MMASNVSLRLKCNYYANYANYRDGYNDGYDDGYREACLTWQNECQKLRDVLRAMLSDTIEHGEAPEHDKKGDL